MFELFIAKRYLRAKHSLNLISFISLISVFGITIGVAALIIVLSVFNGFSSLVVKNLIEFEPHIRILNKENADIFKIDSLLGSISEISYYEEYAEGKVILFNNGKYEVITLKGLNLSDKNNEGIAKKIVSGSYPRTSDSGILISSILAIRLGVFTGDTLIVSSFSNIEKVFLNFGIPQSKKFVITGIFETNSRDIDFFFSFTDKESAEKIFGMKGIVSGYEIRLKDLSDTDRIKAKIESGESLNVTVYSWYDLHKDLYDVMMIERWTAYVILCLIIAVATFNILGSLAMFVIEKKKDIGVLKSMGAERKSIVKIFIFEGLLIGAAGTIIGLVIGLAVCYIQLSYKVYPLDPSRYIIDAIPIEISIIDVVAVSSVSVILSLAAAVLPAVKASSGSIIEAIKWE